MNSRKGLFHDGLRYVGLGLLLCFLANVVNISYAGCPPGATPVGSCYRKPASSTKYHCGTICSFQAIKDPGGSILVPARIECGTYNEWTTDYQRGPCPFH